MDIFFILLPVLFIVVFYSVIFTRKGEAQRVKGSFKRYDWITNLAIVFGTIALLSGCWALGLDISGVWPIVLMAVFCAALIGIIVYRIKTGKPIIKCTDDERTEIIYAKSSRNGLLATFLAFFIINAKATATIETKWVVVALAAGIITLLGSTIFYYFRRS